MRAIWWPLAWYGGRALAELRERDAGECDTSIAVGLLGLVSIGIIFAGHLLFWSHMPHTASAALLIAAFIAALFAALYRVLLRVMEVMHWVARSVMLSVVAVVMGVNAALAGHELVLLAFKPQVEAQAKLSAAKGQTQYATAVEESLGLPGLRGRTKQLDDAIAAANAERRRVPEDVQSLQRQAQACDATAANLRARVPTDPEDPGHASALGQWREQRGRCQALTARAERLLADHRAQQDTELSRLGSLRQSAAQSLAEASASHDAKITRDRPALSEAATTGFARHDALWAAVEARRIPAWAAYGLMFVALALDAFSFLVKLLAREDAATADRRVAVDGADLFNRLRHTTVAQQSRLVKQAVGELQPELLGTLSASTREAVLPAVSQDLEARAFEQAASAVHRAQQHSGKPATQLVRRLVRMAQSQRGPQPRAASGSAVASGT